VDGRFEFPVLPSEEYTFVAAAPAFGTFKAKSFRVIGSEGIQVNAILASTECTVTVGVVMRDSDGSTQSAGTTIIRGEWLGKFPFKL
jgi:hypothetical protein